MDYSDAIADLVERKTLVWVEYNIEDFTGLTGVSVTEEGEVWLEDAISGHWMEEEEKAEFLAYLYFTEGGDEERLNENPVLV